MLFRSCLRRTASYGKREETNADRPAPAVCARAGPQPRAPARQPPAPPPASLTYASALRGGALPGPSQGCEEERAEESRGA